MAKFRKKPVVIDAWPIRGGEADGDLAQAVVDGKLRYCEDGSVLIDTLEGVMQGFVGDWIIRGVKGEFYPCKPDIFAATYEPAEHVTDIGYRVSACIECGKVKALPRLGMCNECLSPQESQ
jgi:hypothetical protein